MGKDNNKSNKKEKKKHLSAVSMIVLIVLAICYVVTLYFISYNEIKNIKKEVLSDDARVFINGEEKGKEKLLKIVNNNKIQKHDKITILMKIPSESDILNPVINSESCNCPETIYVDKKKVYEIGKDSKYGDVIGTESFKVAVKDEWAGKELKVEIDVYDKAAIKTIKDFSYINAYDADIMGVRKQMVNIYISDYIYIFGIICILFHFGGFWKHNESKRELFISVISIAGAVWIMASGRIGTYYGIEPITKYYLEYEALYVMMFCIFQLFYVRLRNVRQRRVLRISNFVLLGTVVIANILRVLKVFYFQELLTCLHMTVMIIALLYYYVTIRNYKKYLEMFVLYTALIVGLIFYVVLYNFKFDLYTSGTDIASLTVFILGIYMFVSLIDEIKRSYMDKIEREALLNKVYEDKLTRISNRRICENKMKEIDKQEEAVFLIYSFDINGLKEQNDKYGHEKGDELIVAFADALRNVFDSSDFIGRMGGDEFVAIQKLVSKDVIDETLKLDELSAYIEKENESKKHNFIISYASGWTICDRRKDDKAWEAYNRADQDMYDCKRKMKQKQNSN